MFSYSTAAPQNNFKTISKPLIHFYKDLYCLCCLHALSLMKYNLYNLLLFNIF